MFVSIRASVILILFIGVIGNIITKTSAEENRNILFNAREYHDEKEETKEKLYKLAIKICPNHTEEIKHKIEELENCSLEVDEDNNTMCQVIQINLNTCIVPLFDYYETCVPKKTKGVPTYVLETARHLTKFVCDSDGYHLLELGNPCILKNYHVDSRRCIRKLKKEALKYHYENLPVKQEICLFVQDFKSCYDKHVDEVCKDTTTREAYKGLYENLVCKKNDKKKL